MHIKPLKDFLVVLGIRGLALKLTQVYLKATNGGASLLTLEVREVSEAIGRLVLVGNELLPLIDRLR